MTYLQRGWRSGTALGLVVAVTGCDGGGADDEAEAATGETVGDGDGDPEGGYNGIPLELQLAVFDETGTYLVLRFSEPMAPVTGVDPSDFRVSFARTVNYTGYYGEYQWSFYVDPNVYYSTAYEYKTLEPDIVGNGYSSTDIVLRFPTPLDPQVCAWLAQWEDMYEANPSIGGKVALFPHYSPGAVPVRSVDGEVLAAIGPGWAEYASSAMTADGYGWPHLDPQIPIPCNL